MRPSYSALLSFLTFSAALPTETTIERRADAYNPPRNIAYVQTFRRPDGGQFSLLPLINNPSQITHIYLSALHINSNASAITLNDNNPNSTVFSSIWSEVPQLQAKGVKVMYMMGGAAAGSYPRLCSGPSSTIINETYYMPLYYELKYRNLDGIDLDIEEKVAYTCPLALLKRLAADFGPNFITTMSPVASELQKSGYGLGGFSYKTLDSQATLSTKPNGKLVNWYNTQNYNGWGDASSPNGYNAIVNNGFAASRVVLGVLDAPADGGSGWKPLATYQKTIKTLKANYGSAFGCVSAWEYWDAGRNDSLREPYMWVGGIGNTVFGTSNTFTKRGEEEDEVDVEGERLLERQTGQQDFNATITFGTSPWPILTDQLRGLGYEQLAVVRALNISNGDYVRALTILGSGA